MSLTAVVRKWSRHPFRDPRLNRTICVVTNVRRSYIQALAAQQTLELRQNLSKLADNAVETSTHRYLCRMNE